MQAAQSYTRRAVFASAAIAATPAAAVTLPTGDNPRLADLHQSWKDAMVSFAAALQRLDVPGEPTSQAKRRVTQWGARLRELEAAMPSERGHTRADWARKAEVLAELTKHGDDCEELAASLFRDVAGN